MVQLIKWNPRQDSIFACLETFLQNVLMQGDAHIILKHMGNMLFAGIEKRCQMVKGEILVQMVVDIIADI